MSSEEILDLLARTGAVTAGHFDLGNGTHTDWMFRIVKATQFAPFNRKLCYEIVRHYLELDIHVVVAASVAAIPIAVEIGRQLEARAIFAERSDGDARLFDGFELHDGERAIVVEGLLESDEQTEHVSKLIRKANARLVGIGSIVDTRPVKRRLTVKDVAALQLHYPHFDAGSCPLCASGAPIVWPPAAE